MICWPCLACEWEPWCWKMYQMLSVHVHISMNYWIHTEQPMRLYNSFFNVVGFVSLMTQRYSGLALNSLLSILHLRNFALVRKVHSTSVQKLFQYEYIFLKYLWVDQVVINVRGYVSTRHNSGQDFCYATRKDLSGRHKTEGQTCVLVASVILYKCCFVANMFIDDNLPVAVAVVQVALNICCLYQFCWTSDRSLTEVKID